jgi:hypothetical protein
MIIACAGKLIPLGVASIRPIAAFAGSTGCTFGRDENAEALAVSVSAFGRIGTGNDAVILERALATGRAVRIPTGTTLTIASDIRLQPGQVLFGEGAESRIQLRSNHAADNVKLRLADRTTIRDLHVEEVGAIGRTGLYGTILAEGASHCAIRRVEVSGSSSTGMMFIASTHIEVDGCHVHDTMADGIHAQRGSQGIAIADCRIERTGDDGIAFVSHGFDQHGSVAQCSARHCTITDVRTTGSGVAVIGATDTTVVDCQISGTPMSGIRITSATFGAEGATICRRVTVTGNTVEHAGIGPAIGNNGGIFVEGARDITIAANRIVAPRSWGIATSNIVRDIRITGNVIDAPGDVGMFISTAPGDDGYRRMWHADDPAATLASSDVTIDGNTITRPVAAGIHVGGLPGFPSSDVIVRANIIQAIQPGPGRGIPRAVRVDPDAGIVILCNNRIVAVP